MKFSDLVPEAKPWDDKVSNYLGQTLTIKAFEPVRTTYGNGFVCVVDTTDADGKTLTNLRLLVGNTVLCDQLVKLSDALADNNEDFPIDVKVIRVKGANQRYLMFTDPD